MRNKIFQLWKEIEASNQGGENKMLSKDLEEKLTILTENGNADNSTVGESTEPMLRSFSM